MRDRDDLFDKEIRDKLKKEINVVPEESNKKMNDAFNKLGKKKYKKVAGVCAACVVGTLIFGITMPTYAQNIPVIGKIFEVFDDNRYENYDKYSSDLNVTKESNGYRVTINKIAYDGIELNIFYTVQSDEPIESEIDIVDMDLKIKNKKLNLGFGARGELINENTYVGMRDYTVNSDDLVPKELREKRFGGDIDIPDKFNLKINIDSLGSLGTEGDIKGNWDFNIPVSSELVNGNVHEKELNLELGDATIKKFIQTPINTVIQGVKYEEEDSNSDMNFVLFDNKGRYIVPKGANSSGFPYGEKGIQLYFTYNFKEVYEDSESLTVIPFKGKPMYNSIEQESEENNQEKVSSKEYVIASEDVSVTENKESKIKLNAEGDKEILLNNGRIYSKINKLESDGKITKVYFESENSIYGMPLYIVNNKGGEKIFPIGASSIGDTEKAFAENLKYLGDNKYVVSFDGDLTEGDYSAVFSIDEYYERAGNSIIIDLK
ncbi:DUF4179 domain-containing protein [Clostridium sp. B9]|uniref:DUF4179 domain-containing protein n=1 Tax=Clostridium sp. B9 TaxID=3423224 RepID=UPI003D2F2221